MLEQKVIINIFGPSCGGKSTTADLLKERVERLYIVDFDVVKRQFSDFYWKRDRQDAEMLTLDLLESATKTGLPLLALLPPPKSAEDFKKMLAIAIRNDYRVINVEIYAPDEILIARYADRLKRIEESGTKWKFKTMDEYKDTLNKSYFKPEKRIEFDSSIDSPESIVDNLLTVIKDS